MKVPHDPVLDKIRSVYAYTIDLEDCDTEPLHHIGVIQSHTALLAAELTGQRLIRYASENAASILGIEWETAVDQPLTAVLPPEVTLRIDSILADSAGPNVATSIPALVSVNGEHLRKNFILHRSSIYLIIEVEPVVEMHHTPDYQRMLGEAITRIQNLTDPAELFAESARVIRRVTGYDRVMVYRFDEDYNGEVIAEARRDDWEPYLGLHYPHTDIPKPARELYLRNKIRAIADVDKTPARLFASSEVADQHLDLSLAHCRGVSPVHLEYLTNMGVRASMSIAIIVNDRLWGLFALHHGSPKFLDYDVRSFLLFVGRVFSGHLTIRSAQERERQTIDRGLVHSEIGEQITATQDLFRVLASGKLSVLNLFEDTIGACVFSEQRYRDFGTVPSEKEVSAMIAAAKEQPDSKLFYRTATLSELGFERTETAAGLMVIFLNLERTDWICWFRPERARKIQWGGRPVKEIIESPDGTKRLGPRKSFTRFVELVRGKSKPWTQKEIDGALALRVIIQNSLMRRYVAVKRANTNLKQAYQDLETFSYTVTHDLRAPLRAIDGFAEILVEDYGELLAEEGEDILRRIQQSTEQMNAFISDILELSRVDRIYINPSPLDTPTLVRELIAELRPAYLEDKEIAFEIDEGTPSIIGDKLMIRQLLLNLLSNAMKYVQPGLDGVLRVRVGYLSGDASGNTTFEIWNSGPRIPEEYRRSIFDIFSRMNSSSEIEGSGVGLAIVKRIVERHNGKVWVDEAGPGVGFRFYLNAPEGTDKAE